MECDICNKNVSRLKRVGPGKFACVECYDYKPESYVFRSFFDQSMGCMIGSSIEKREIEKKYGVTYMSNNDRNALVKESRKNIRDKKREKNTKAIKEIMDNVHRGYSYINRGMN